MLTLRDNLEASEIPYKYFKEAIEKNPLSAKGEEQVRQIDDYVIELGLTPNRMDLLSMLGVAKDVNAMYRLGLKELPCEFTEVEKETKDEEDVKLFGIIVNLIV